jgi:hypothetical protein
MADNQSLINQLLDTIENLLIENRAYVIAVKRSSPETRELADQMIAMAKNDPVLLATVRAAFAPFRNQSSEQSIQEILKKLKDVN